jgi:acyl-coenzyme A synthetase/AMP-(fatty) acid ligase/pimeloyl-ACP methyl ester carboxylesterase
MPPGGMPGLDPAWSRLVVAIGADGDQHTWHCLDSWPVDAAEPVGTLLCVHGNPTWSYLWRSLLAGAPPGWRVVAVDHLGMGYSDRVATPQRLADRVADLGTVVAALGVTGPVVTVAHDWGGSISLGWALAHRSQVAGVVLTNTAVSQPAGSPVPGLIALARTPGVLRTACVLTPTFLAGTLRLAHPALPSAVRAAYSAPYRGAGRRQAIGDFVADIPLRPGHPSYATLAAIGAGLGALADVPVLLLWGPRDPVFSDRYLHDLIERLPHAQVHRFEGAGHLVVEDRDLAAPIRTWLAPLSESILRDDRATRLTVRLSLKIDSETAGRVLWAALDERAEDQSPAIVEMGTGGSAGRTGAAAGRTVSFAAFGARTRELAAGLAASGVRQGDRVALLVPPGADLAAAVYACWRIGAVIVLADAGLGLRGMSRALRGAGPQHLIGIPRALAAARVLGWPGQVIAAGPANAATLRAVGAHLTLAEVAALGRHGGPDGRPLPLPPEPGPDAEAAILFTSGATGPAKGVVYRHRQLQAQRDALVHAYAITPDDRLVAAFAPFALYGPALGIASVVPDMDVTSPATLEATALAEAVEAVQATLVFSSPAALVSIERTSDRLTPRHHDALRGVRLLLSAGAPVPASLLRRVARLMPSAEPHTPYGMTEALPVSDITLAEIERVSSDAAASADPGADNAEEGICVGHPLDGVQVTVLPLDELGRPDPTEPTPTDKAGVTGEICVRAAHVKDRYDRLWVTEQASRPDLDDKVDDKVTGEPGWHRTGDVGHLDDDGRLWVEGRLVHVIATADGVVTPVGVEQRVETLQSVQMAAVVGVGPVGTQAVVVVVVPTAPGNENNGNSRSSAGTRTGRHGGLADEALAAQVRTLAAIEVAAVLVAPALPVDIRHNSKIDRARVAAWADRILTGRRAGRL